MAKGKCWVCNYNCSVVTKLKPPNRSGCDFDLFSCDSALTMSKRARRESGTSSSDAPTSSAKGSSGSGEAPAAGDFEQRVKAVVEEILQSQQTARPSPPPH